MGVAVTSGCSEGVGGASTGGAITSAVSVATAPGKSITTRNGSRMNAAV